MAVFDNSATRIGATILLVSGLIVVIVSLLPVVPLPSEIESAIRWLFSSLWSFNFLIPVQTLITLFTISMSLMAIKWSIKGVMIAVNLYFRLKT